MPMHDLLIEPAFQVTLRSGRSGTLTLPGVIASLARDDDIVSFDHLRPHQQHAWHAFLVQLAAIALSDAGSPLDSADESTWRDRLRHLTHKHGDHAPWCLVVEDLSLPAFMQPPVPEGHLEALEKVSVFPDAPALELLSVARQHDVKATRVAAPDSDHWAYALVGLQTMQAYSGSNQHAIARMDGGAGTRSCVALAPGLDFGLRFRRDLAVLLEVRQELAAQYGYPAAGGLALLWVEPWDGSASLPLSRLDPYFIEVCRRVRLMVGAKGIEARTAPSAQPRIAAKAARGNTGDPWAPVSAEGKALTVHKDGFSYRELEKLLFGRDWTPGPAQRVARGDPPALLLLAVSFGHRRRLTGLEGFHERLLPLPGRVVRNLTAAEGRDLLAQMAKQRVEAVQRLQRNVLRPSLGVLFKGWSRAVALDRDPWLRRHDAAVDQLFFPRLWRDLERGALEAQLEWEREIIELGRTVLREAQESVPLATARRYRAFAAAEGLFEALARRHFPDLFAHKEVTHGHNAQPWSDPPGRP